MGEEESLAATDVVQSEVISQPHYSNKDIVVPAALLASALLAVFVLSACKVCRRKKDPQLDLLNPCIVVYPSYQGTTPQFLNKDIQFSLPQIRRSESFDELTRDDSEGEPPPLLPRRAQAQRSNSFSCYGLGAIDPTLYQGAHNFEEDLDYPEGHLGRVWFSLRYEVSSEKLLVTLVKVKNLPSRTVGTTNNCDPFVRSCCLPLIESCLSFHFILKSWHLTHPLNVNHSSSCKVVILLWVTSNGRRSQKSRQKRKTCNPYFDETFVFQVAPKELAGHSLRMSVIDIGRSRRRGVVGHVVFPLRGHPVDSSAEIAIYQVDLLKETSDSISDLGELYISLVYNENSHRLTVSVLEARNLKFTEDRQKNSYVRVTLNQHYRTVKVKRTTTVRNSDVPKYSQGFTLNVPSSIIDMTSVILQVYQTGSPYGKDKEIGKVILGSYMFARGKPLTHWNTALANPMEQIQQWHPLCA